MPTITKYLLPCECGEAIPLEVSQAGQTVRCEACGKSQEAPSMRGIRALPTTEVETERRVELRESNWSLGRGAFFSAMLLVAVLAFAFAGLQYLSLRSIGKVYSEEEATVVFDELIDDFDAEQAYSAWQEFRDHGMGPKRPADYVQFRNAAEQLRMVVTVSLIIGTVALVAAVASIAMSRGSKTKATKTE
ncbi:MAG: hypothetical protein KDA59_23340 [Planctomycetales bacterium]|nr:hypothetical protein [Planctomycetales bacterium]